MGGGKDVVVEIEENIRLEGWWRYKENLSVDTRRDVHGSTGTKCHSCHLTNQYYIVSWCSRCSHLYRLMSSDGTKCFVGALFLPPDINYVH
jgi:hypothetical protein